MSTSNNESKTINSLEEFLAWRGFSIDDGPYYWARCFYKYTACGPWAIFILDDGREVYYEDKGVNETVTNDNCVGIKFGSIVEGSEAYSGPFTHMFPFETKAFEHDEKWMEDETSFYWERDNSYWYQLQVGEKHYFCHASWGDIKWDGPPPSAALRKKIETFINEHADKISHEPHLWGAPKPDWKPTKIPGSKAEIWECFNDTTFD